MQIDWILNGGTLLDRAEAIRVLKEIIVCTNCYSPFVALMPPNARNLLSKGYQIHIKTQLDKSQRDMLEDILKKNKLALEEDKETLIIYKPIQK